MTGTVDTTMADAETADTTFKTVTRANKSKRLKATLVQPEIAERAHGYTIRAYFPPPQANTKFNPVSSMRGFFAEVIKYEPSLVVVSIDKTEQLELAKQPLPTTEDAFKRYFAVTPEIRAGTHKQHLSVGCHIRSERSFNDIKFDKTKPQLLEWMKQNKIFVESDNLGINKTTAIGHLTTLHPDLTNRTILKDLLRTALEEVVLDAKLAVDLDPSLKPLYQQATTNGDTFIPEIPPFTVYKTRISHNRDKLKVKTDIIGVKCASDKAKLLKEFFSQLASPEHYEKQIGVFVPTGAVHSLGSDNYAKLLSDNNVFLKSVVTIPVGDFSRETLDIPFSFDSDTDIDQTTLADILMEQTWCLNVEKTSTHNKVLLTTTKTNLETARKWIDTTLPNLYNQHVADKLDVTLIKKMIPRRLDKPILTTASTAYADKLKQRLTSTEKATPLVALTTQPPRNNKTKATGITFDEKTFPALNTNNLKENQRSTTTNITAAKTTKPTDNLTTPQFDYKAELQRLSVEIETNLKKQFEAIFANMEQKIDDLAKQNEHYRQEQKLRFEDQEIVNNTVTKQLSYLVDNMKNILKYATPNATIALPLLNSNGPL